LFLPRPSLAFVVLVVGFVDAFLEAKILEAAFIQTSTKLPKPVSPHREKRENKKKEIKIL